MYDALQHETAPSNAADAAPRTETAQLSAAPSDPRPCGEVDQGRLAAPTPRPYGRPDRRASAPAAPRGDALSDLTDELFGYYRRG